MKRIIMLCLVMAFMVSGKANATVIAWTGANGGDVTSSNFNTRTQLFSSTTADEFSWLGAGYFHAHSGSVTSTLELLLNNVWTQVGSAVTSTGSQIPSNTLSSTYSSVSFASAAVTGIRFGSSINQNQTYHGVSGNFELTNSVPTPTTLALLGLGLVGIGAMRRKLV